MAFTGQSNTQSSHSIQSSGYLMTAFSLFSSIRKTSVGQMFTQIPQPLHNSRSILSIAISITSRKSHGTFIFSFTHSHNPGVSLVRRVYMVQISPNQHQRYRACRSRTSFHRVPVSAIFWLRSPLILNLSRPESRNL